MKNHWLQHKEDELRLQIREELRASMEKEYLLSMREMAEMVSAALIHADEKIEALEEENRVLRMANLVGIKIADKFAKE